MNNSNLSVNLGSEGFLFVSGETSTGQSQINVGFIKVSSTLSSKI